MRISRRLVSHHGFTRADLGGVLAGVFLLGLLASSCGNSTRRAAEAAGCANNLRHLSQAWLAHGAENPSLVGNGGLPNPDSRSSWALGWLDWGSSGVNTNTLILQTRAFASYAGSDTSVFRCPSDRFVSSSQEALGWRYRARSYSMNGYVGTGGRGWNERFRQFTKQSDFVSPSQTLVFVDEHPDSMNDPWFATDPTGATVPDIPGSLHSRGTHLSFADGHVERRAWVGVRLALPVRFNIPSISGNPDADSRWLGERASQPLP
jgi:prepilin-type processing-associated H-X9-DG protein